VSERLINGGGEQASARARIETGGACCLEDAQAMATALQLAKDSYGYEGRGGQYQNNQGSTDQSDDQTKGARE